MQNDFTRRRQNDVDAVKASISLLETVQNYGVKLRRQGREYVGLSPFKAERTPSFYVDTQKNLFHCFASGEGGDIIRFVQLMDGCGFKDALAKLTGEARLDDPAERERRASEYRWRAKSDAERNAAREAFCRRTAASIWKAAQPAEGTLVEVYLRSRGIDLDAIQRVYGFVVPPTLRFLPQLQYRHAGMTHCGPAMIGLIQSDIRKVLHFRGVHRTWLAADGQGKANLPKTKLVLGSQFGGEGRLSPVRGRAVIGEGYETTLSMMALLARRGEKVFGVSAISLGNLAGGADDRAWDGVSPRKYNPVPNPQRPGLTLPEGVTEAVILQDADGADPQEIDVMIRRAAAKFYGRGARVHIAMPPLGKDFNDLVQESAA